MAKSEHASRIQCQNEFSTLKRVIVCEPLYMSIHENINVIQRKFSDEEFDNVKALEQHRVFVNTLKGYGVDVITLPAHKHLPEQIFTRDIGFTIDRKMFVAKMAQEARSGEEAVLIDWLKSTKTPFRDLTEHKIEGGDVLVHGSKLFVGHSGRTSEEAINLMAALLPEHEIIPLRIDPKYLHLDCVFNTISENEALYFPEAFDQKDRDLLSGHFNLIEITAGEQFTLGTNVLSIGSNTIISLPGNREVNDQLRERGFEVIEVDISEIIKSGGSFRCCTLPVLREGQ